MPGVYDVGTNLLRRCYGLWIHTPPVLDVASHFPMAAHLQRNWRHIRREILHLVSRNTRIPKFHHLMANQAEISDNDGIPWRVFMLRAYGQDQMANQALCPATAKLIQAIPNVIGACFSILEAGKHIPAHRGPYRGFLRYHLPLYVPKDEAGESLAALRVDKRCYRLREGRGILWDDTYEHEAWNRGRSPRIVLIVDIARPGMPPLLRAIDRCVYATIVRSDSLRAFLAKSEVSVETGHRAG
jgi:aspartate beta-hydroxylase